MLSEYWRRLLFLFKRRQLDRDLEEEMRFHLEMQSAAVGSAEARRRFGNATLWREDTRAARGWSALESWIDDVRYALRGLRKNPGFTAVAVLTLALGIGAGTAVFAVVNAVLLRPLPFAEPNRLAMVWQTSAVLGIREFMVPLEDFHEWQRQSRTFEQLVAYRNASGILTIDGERSIVPGSGVSSGFFQALGVQPILGRVFVPEEERTGGPAAVLLSHRLWQKLGGDRAIAGKTIPLDGHGVPVVGVMPANFDFPAGAEMWSTFADPVNRSSLRVIGRLRAGASMAKAQSEMDTIAARLRAAQPRTHPGVGAHVVPLKEQILGNARPALLVLMGAVACLLLIACANVANLLLVRAAGRRRELSLRLALGAGQWRVVRCLLSESILVSLAGAALGVAAAYALVGGFVALDPVHVPRVREIAVDGPVLLCAVAAAIVTGLLFGLMPALAGARCDPANGLKNAGGGDLGGSRGRAVLAAAQMALAVVLLVGAGLLLRSFIARVTVPLGFRPEGVLGVELPWSVNRNVEELLDRLRALPGVQAAGAATAFPQDAAGTSCGGCLEVEGRPRHEGHEFATGYMVTTPGYFQAAGMMLRGGRYFDRRDGADAPQVAVVNEALVRRDFPNENPIGRHVRWGTGQWATVIGVAGNMKGFGVEGEPMPALYFPQQQASWGNGVQVLVRTSVPPRSMAGTVRREIRAWRPNLLISKLDTVDNMLASMVAVPRFYMLLVTGFAVLALAVSAVGVYGTINYSVARRTHEIGIRMALGAGRGDVLAMILRQALTLAAAGVVIGLVGAWASTHLLETLLFGVRARDAVAFTSAAMVLAVAVAVAAYFPARRATRVDPLVSLRHE